GSSGGACSMNTERLLTCYERIAEAPDAVSRLRGFVLELAVRGKLLPQDPKDGEANEILVQIAKARAKPKKQIVSLPPIKSNDQPFNIPSNWRWVRLNDLADLVYGKLLPTRELLPEGFDVFGANGVIGKYSRYLYNNQMLLISCRGAYSGT